MSDVRWEPPGPGAWELDLAHCLGAMTPICQQIQSTSIQSGMRELFATFGVPADTIDARFVNGYFYTRLRPLMGADKPPAKLPPAFVLKLAFAVHPELRRRKKKAEATMRDKPWREAIRHWETTEREEFEAENLAWQDVDVAALSDESLAEHFEEVLAGAQVGYHRHFVLHGFDLGPIGLLLVSCREWGIDPADVVPALLGASPSTSEPARILSRLREIVATSGTTPATLDEVRNLSPAAATELDRYLRYRGMLVFSRYDIDGVTLGELPDVVLTSILAGRDAGSTDGAEEAAAAIRARVPVADQDSFDDLLREARFAMNLRDDNGPTTAEWRLGLIRRALLEAGSRLAARGRITDANHAFELEPDEVVPILTAGAGPTADELASRAKRRAELSELDPPPTLGPPEPAPPLDVLPAAQARMLDVVQTVTDQLARVELADGLSGTGVGTVAYTGRVLRASNPEEAIARIEPGDVLVVPFTTPAYNGVLPLAGAIVTVHGGPLCHAAVLARELGIPAVVGAAAAFTQLHDGATVEVDAVLGQVRVVEAAGTPA